MNKVLIFPIVFLIASCFIGFTTSLHCYVCDSSLSQNCNHSRSAKCDPALAQQTVNYVLTHTWVNETTLQTTSSTYRCVNDFISTYNGSQLYLGCSYSSLDMCLFTPRVEFRYRTCESCNSNNCNYSPAARATSNSFFTLTASIILALIAKVIYY